ncbi:MAG: hypothetical protein ACR2NP_00845 [Pirellulaceae bacterium]
MPKQTLARQMALRVLIAALFVGAVFMGARNASADRDGDAQLRIDTRVTQTELQVAESFDLEISITAPQGTSLEFPPVTGRLGDFEVLDHDDRFDIPGEYESSERMWIRRMTLESLITGGLEVPRMEFRASSTGNSEVLYSESIPVQVVSVLEDHADPANFRDIQSVVDVYIPTQPRRFPTGWIAGVVSFLAIALAAMTVITRRRTCLSPRDWAIAELNSLHGIAEISPEPVVARKLSAVLREYLELQFEVAAPLQTTAELLSTLDQQVESTTARRLASLLALADEAKFAGLRLTSAQLTTAIEESQQLVKKLSRQFEEPAAASTESSEGEAH